MLTDDTLLSDVEFVALDLETTGLLSSVCQIVEIGALRFRLDGAITDTFEQLVNPNCEIPEDATAVHGISNDMVRGQPTIDDVLRPFAAFLGHEDNILLAHNAHFDVDFLAAAMARCGISFPPHAVLDTLEITPKILLNRPSYRLEDLAVFLGIADVEEHRGLADSVMLASVFRALVCRSPQLQTLGDLLACCTAFRFNAKDTGRTPSLLGLGDLPEAIRQRQIVIIVYDGGSKGLSERRVTPQGLSRFGGNEYLTAYCHTDGKVKKYRLDRIQQIRFE